MIEELRQRLRGLEKPPGLEDGPAALPLGASAVDRVLGGGLMRGALHEIAALGEAHAAAATGFVAGVAALAALSSPSPRLQGEGWGEGAFPKAQTCGEAPSPGSLRDPTSPYGRGEDDSRQLSQIAGMPAASVSMAFSACSVLLGRFSRRASRFCCAA